MSDDKSVRPVRADLADAAAGLQAQVLFHSVVDKHPGAVPDPLIATLKPAPELDAEMCDAGLWARVDGGYRILDGEAVAAMSRLVEGIKCDVGVGHTVNSGSEECIFCHNILDPGTPRHTLPPMG